MNGLFNLFNQPGIAALAINLGVPSVLILGAAWLFMKAVQPSSAPLRRGLLLAAILSAVLAPAAGYALYLSGVSLTVSPLASEAPTTRPPLNPPPATTTENTFP